MQRSTGVNNEAKIRNEEMFEVYKLTVSPWLTSGSSAALFTGRTERLQRLENTNIRNTEEAV